MQLGKADIDEALDYVLNEFHGLDLDQQYRNAFARLLKKDPLERVAMLGTDQRDLFIPLVKDAAKDSLSQKGHIFDFGAGDGQTFLLFADSLPMETTVSIEEPNEKYAARYWESIRSIKSLRHGVLLVTDFDSIDDHTKKHNLATPKNSSINLGLAIHMLYFVDNLSNAICKMFEYIAVGGTLVLIVAEENNAYTGHVARRYYETKNKQEELKNNIDKCNRRYELLGPPPHGGKIVDVLQEAHPHASLSFSSLVQESRLYGHTISDIIALSNIAELAQVNDIDKFVEAGKCIIGHPEMLGFRVESDQGPRLGMLSVRQPQIVATIKRLS